MSVCVSVCVCVCVCSCCCIMYYSNKFLLKGNDGGRGFWLNADQITLHRLALEREEKKLIAEIKKAAQV